MLSTVLWTCNRKHPEARADQQQRAKKWDRQRDELEYRLIRAALELSRSEKLYMVLNMERKELQLKLKGALLWNHPINTVETDSQKLHEFAKRFQGDDGRVVRFLSAKHLFNAQDKTPDSVLAIVGEVVKADHDLLQRDVPARFQLLWGYDLTLEVRTDIVGKPKSPIKNALMEFRHAWRGLFGEVSLVVKMSPDEALTLYRAAQPGLPTILCPTR